MWWPLPCHFSSPVTSSDYFADRLIVSDSPIHTKKSYTPPHSIFIWVRTLVATVGAKDDQGLCVGGETQHSACVLLSRDEPYQCLQRGRGPKGGKFLCCVRHNCVAPSPPKLRANLPQLRASDRRSVSQAVGMQLFRVRTSSSGSLWQPAVNLRPTTPTRDIGYCLWFIVTPQIIFGKRSLITLEFLLHCSLLFGVEDIAPTLLQPVNRIRFVQLWVSNYIFSLHLFFYCMWISLKSIMHQMIKQI